MKRLVLILALAGLLIAPAVALAQCGPNGCGPNGCGPGANNGGGVLGMLGGPSPQASAAQPMQPNSAINRVVEIGQNNGRREFCYGTAFLIEVQGGKAVWLTCAHTFAEIPGEGDVFIALAGKNTQGFRGKVVALDAKLDLALVETPAPKGIRPIVIADKPPSNGEAVTCYGYAGGKEGEKFGGWAGSYRLVNATTIEVQGGARLGDSGGPMLNAQGQVVGVLTSTNGQATYGTGLTTIQTWISQCGWTPWQNLQEQVNGLQTENAQLRAQLAQPQQQAPPLPPVEPPPVPPPAGPDAATIAKLADLDARLRSAEQTIANVQAVGDKLATEFPQVAAAIAEVKAKAEKADGEAAGALIAADDAGKKADAAAGDVRTVADAVPGIAEKVAGAVVERTLGEKVKDALAPIWTWVAAHWGVTGIIALAVVFLVFRRVQTGQSVVQRVTDRTPWTFDDQAGRNVTDLEDRIVDRVARRVGLRQTPTPVPTTNANP